MAKRIVVADPRGFCAGVDRAIETVRAILDITGPSRDDGLAPVYVRRQIVHNRHVVEELRSHGAQFVNELADIPQEAAGTGIPVVFSAHGVSPAVVEEAQTRHLLVVDATCPLVGKVHREASRFVRDGYEVVYIGHRGHDEAMGVVGESPDHIHLIERAEEAEDLHFSQSTKLALLTQTTLSVEETADTIAVLRQRFPWIEMPAKSDICYATTNRQAAVRIVARQCDCVVIIGSANSSNSVRLMEVAQQALGQRGRAYRVDDARELDSAWFDHVESVGLSSGASVPEPLVQDVIARLRDWGFTHVDSLEGVREQMHFALPTQLRSMPGFMRIR